MPKHRDLELSKYSISKERYRELYYFCLQYDERAKKISELETLSVRANDGMPHGTGISDPSSVAGIRAAQLRLQNEDIEESAMEADAELFRWLLESVKHGYGYSYMHTARGIPCGEKMFRRARHKFFYCLDRRRS